jgi:hypothetical protein
MCRRLRHTLSTSTRRPEKKKLPSCLAARLPMQALDHATGYILAFSIAAAFCKTVTVRYSPHVLMSIAESFSSQQTPVQPNALSSPPPASFAVGRGPFVNASSSGVPPSLVDLRRKLVKFMLGDEGHSVTINVEDCMGGVEVLEKVLKKFGKFGAKNTELEGADRVGTSDGGLSVDGWSVFLDWGNEASPGTFSCANLSSLAQLIQVARLLRHNCSQYVTRLRMTPRASVA